MTESSATLALVIVALLVGIYIGSEFFPTEKTIIQQVDSIYVNSEMPKEPITIEVVNCSYMMTGNIGTLNANGNVTMNNTPIGGNER